MPKYIVRKRKWPFSSPLKRPWELLRDDLVIGFYETPEAAESAKAAAEEAKPIDGGDLLDKLRATGLVKGIHPTGTVRGMKRR